MKLGVTARMLLGLGLGISIGLVLAANDAETARSVADVVEPFGKLWLNALQMTVVPLVLALVIVGVNVASDAAHSGRVARRAITTFLLLLSGGAAIAALLAPPILALFTPDPAIAEALRAGDTQPATGGSGWAAALTAMIPSNVIAAAAANAMLPLVVFAMFFGFAVTRLDEAQRSLIVDFFKAISEAMIVIVRWVLVVGPIGVFALVLALSARAGMSVLGALGLYIGLECLLYILVTLLMLPVALVFAREAPARFIAALTPVQAVAASTQSSLATLPAMLASSKDRLGYPREVSSLVLPMAVSLFRLTSPVQYIATACFIAWALGVQLSPGTLAAGAILAVIVSLGSVGLPGQAIFIATNLPVTQAMGLPVGPLGVLMALDAIPDVLATVGNVTGDMTANAVVVRKGQEDAAGAGTAAP